ncbi:MAG TPA: hypothetical protein VGH15_10100 [Caulobacteraceae bacterium]|jgi:hypothetical protein
MEAAVPTAWSTSVARDQGTVMLDRRREVTRAITRGDAAAGAAMETHSGASIGDLLAVSEP